MFPLRYGVDSYVSRRTNLVFKWVHYFCSTFLEGLCEILGTNRLLTDISRIRNRIVTHSSEAFNFIRLSNLTDRKTTYI